MSEVHRPRPPGRGWQGSGALPRLQLGLGAVLVSRPCPLGDQAMTDERTGAEVARDLAPLFETEVRSMFDARITCKQCGARKSFDLTAADIKPFHSWIQQHFHRPSNAN